MTHDTHATRERVRARIGHVATTTSDLDRFRRFYEDVLGMCTVLVEHPQGATFRRMAILTDAEVTSVLMVFEVPGYSSGLPEDVIGRRGRLDHLGFRVDSAAFDVTVRRLIDAGASSGRVEEIGAMRSLLFVDPDGAHHNLQTPIAGWRPGPSTDVIGADLMSRLLTP